VASTASGSGAAPGGSGGQGGSGAEGAAETGGAGGNGLSAGGGGGAGGAGGSQDGPVASNFALHVDRDVDPAPTPINQLYLAEIGATAAGDHIVSLQKYFRNEPITSALLDAARRGVQVETVYMQDVDPSCQALRLPGDTFDCSTMFRWGVLCHHKNLMALSTSGVLRAIVGSYNLRVRSTASPRVHTALSFDVANGQPVFAWYQGARQRLLTGSSSQPPSLTIATASGGELTLSLPSTLLNPVRDMLAGLPGCDGTLWVSYFGVAPDTTGVPVFNELERLVAAGCDVRVLLDEDESAGAKAALDSRGIPARFPTYPAGNATLGHKLVYAEYAGETYLLQSSANLTALDVLAGNLTATLRAPELPTIRGVIDSELSRYW
jgi:hypothetical protein